MKTTRTRLFLPLSLLTFVMVGNVSKAQKQAPKATPAPAVAAKPANKNEFAGMQLSPEWLPKITEKRKILVENLRALCQPVVGQSKRGEEPAPQKIWGEIKWLMPLVEATKALGLSNGVGQGTKEVAKVICMPRESLTFVRYSGKFKDLFDFNQLNLVVDQKSQVVAMQFVSTNPKGPRWGAAPLVPDGVKEPYYDYFHLKINAASSKQTTYYKVMEVPGLGKNCCLVKTALHKGFWDSGVCMEDVHWYLPAPLAGRLLDIADFLESGKKPTQP